MARAQSSTGVYGADLSEEEIRHRFVHGSVPVAVYGLGKMGLPLAGVFAEVSGNVTGVDVDEGVVQTINAGECHVKREPGLPELVRQQVKNGAFEATTDGTTVARDAAIHVVIVPTPITEANEPDLSLLDAVTETIARGLAPGDLIIIESTVPPGTSAGRVRKRLSDGSGLSSDEFGVAFCPERTSSGRALEDIRGAYPKVVGGVDEESTRVATAIYEEVTDNDVITTADATTAEAVKVFEGLYRDVNIALANELGQLTDELGINVREAIDVANTQPFCDIHEPGPGVGGHCIPYYPYFIIDPYDGSTDLLETARSVNDAMPAFTVSKLAEEFAAVGESVEGASILVLGLTYRPGVEETRASPAIAITSELTDRGADVYGVDPMLDMADEFALSLIEQEEIYDQPFDGVVLVTDHDEFDHIRWDDVSSPSGSLVIIDGRDSLEVSEDVTHRIYTLGSG